MIRQRAVGLSCLFLFPACANGVDGANGANGIGAAVRVSAVAPGADCAGGGQRIDIGRDDGEGGGTAGNGSLEDGEVDDSTFVCDGAPGDDGTPGDDGAPGDDGFNALLALTAVGPPEC